MLISHKHRTVFVHNPKVAGTSIRNTMLPEVDKDMYHFTGLFDDMILDMSHPRMDQWTEELWHLYRDGYFFFGVVRDPVDRFKSAMSEFQFQQPEFIQQSGKELQDFLVHILSPALIKYDWRFTHFCPQWSYFFPTEASTGCGKSEGPPMWRSPSRIAAPVTILRFEQMDSWWEPLWDHIGAKAPKLKNDRPSFYRPTELSKPLLELILSLYRIDLFRFGYGDTLARLMALADTPDKLGDLGFPFNGANHGTRIETLHRDPEVASHHASRLNEREKRALFQREQVRLDTQVADMMLRHLSDAFEAAEPNQKEMSDDLRRYRI